MENELVSVNVWIGKDLLQHLQQIDPSLSNLLLKRSINNQFEIVHKQEKRKYLAELPNHILFKICEYLLPQDLIYFRMTGNWKILNIASSDQLWKTFVASEFCDRKEYLLLNGALPKFFTSWNQVYSCFKWKDWLIELEANLPESATKVGIALKKIDFSLNFPQCIQSFEVQKGKILKSLYECSQKQAEEIEEDLEFMIKDLENENSIEDSVNTISEISQLNEAFNTFDQLQEGPTEQDLDANVDNAISGVADTLEHLADVINQATQSLILNARRRRQEKEE